MSCKVEWETSASMWSCAIRVQLSASTRPWGCRSQRCCSAGYSACCPHDVHLVLRHRVSPSISRAVWLCESDRCSCILFAANSCTPFFIPTSMSSSTMKFIVTWRPKSINNSRCDDCRESPQSRLPERLIRLHLADQTRPPRVQRVIASSASRHEPPSGCIRRGLSALRATSRANMEGCAACAAAAAASVADTAAPDASASPPSAGTAAAAAEGAPAGVVAPAWVPVCGCGRQLRRLPLEVLLQVVRRLAPGDVVRLERALPWAEMRAATRDAQLWRCFHAREFGPATPPHLTIARGIADWQAAYGASVLRARRILRLRQAGFGFGGRRLPGAAPERGRITVQVAGNVRRVRSATADEGAGRVVVNGRVARFDWSRRR